MFGLVIVAANLNFAGYKWFINIHKSNIDQCKYISFVKVVGI